MRRLNQFRGLVPIMLVSTLDAIEACAVTLPDGVGQSASKMEQSAAGGSSAFPWKPIALAPCGHIRVHLGSIWPHVVIFSRRLHHHHRRRRRRRRHRPSSFAGRLMLSLSPRPMPHVPWD